jgi:hypothetical protein
MEEQRDSRPWSREDRDHLAEEEEKGACTFLRDGEVELGDEADTRSRTEDGAMELCSCALGRRAPCWMGVERHAEKESSSLLLA